MKRKALLIGNTRNLQGVPLDLARMTAFLKSRTGGAWDATEIESLINPAKTLLLARVEAIRQQRPDFSIILFSGHGGHQSQTVLEVNGNGETVTESQLQHVALRQVNIYDCCRVVTEEVRKSIALDSLSAFLESTDDVRKRYDARVLQAIPQQIKLFSCSLGESSYDSPDGAIYLTNFLNSAKSIPSSAEFKTVEQTHAEARVKTHNDKPDQTPDAVLPKATLKKVHRFAM